MDGQTCFGLDKLVLNNNYADATSMKEALIYDMYRYLGADASLYNYAKISDNGEYWGVYLAIEAVEDSFMLRNYGAQSGELYKPDSMNIGGGFDMGGFDMGGFSSAAGRGPQLHRRRPGQLLDHLGGRDQRHHGRRPRARHNRAEAYLRGQRARDVYGRRQPPALHGRTRLLGQRGQPPA